MLLPWPLIDRELRSQARNASTYRNRAGWGLAITIFLALVIVNRPDQSTDGVYLLSVLHVCTAVMLLILGPLGIADSLSREKREGTLGLLLLTKLSAKDVVVGKAAAHAFRVVYLSVMMLPFLMLPVLVGGVGGADFGASVRALLAIMIGGLGSGLAVSAVTTKFGAAIVGSLLVATVALTIVAALVVNLFLAESAWLSSRPLFERQFSGAAYLMLPIAMREGLLTFAPSEVWNIPMGTTLLTFLFGYTCIRFGTVRVAHHGDTAVETKRAAAFRRYFLTPVLLKDCFRSYLSRKLDRNPFHWLEYRSPWSRSARWAAVLLLIGYETMLVLWMGTRDVFGIHLHLLAILSPLMVFKSASSFHQEKESGAFELLLVSPMTEARLVNGRLLAVRAYYRPIIALLFGFGLLHLLWIDVGDYPRSDLELNALIHLVNLTCGLRSIPVTGLFFSLRGHSFFTSLIWIAGLAAVVPIVLCYAFLALVGIAHVPLDWGNGWPFVVPVAGYHLLLGAATKHAAIRLLQSRSFKI